MDKMDGGFLRAQLDGGSRVVVHGSARPRADDDGAWFAEIVPCVPRPDDADRMEVPAEHQLWFDILAQQFAPFAIDVQFDVERLVVDVHERHVADDQAVFHVGRVVFAGGVRDDAFQIVRLLHAEVMACDGVAVFGMAVVFVFAAVENDSPDGTEAECVVEIAVANRREQRELFRHGAAQFVVATGIDNWYFAICDAACDFVDLRDVVVAAQTFRNVAVEDEQIQFLAEILRGGDGRLDVVMGVRQHEYLDVLRLFKRAERIGLFLERFRLGVIFCAFFHDTAA